MRAVPILALTAPALPIAGLQALSARTPGTLQVQVADSSGAAVPDAAVTVTGTDGAVMRGAMDATGLYRTGPLPAGEFKVLVTARAFESFRSPAVSIHNGASETLRVQLQIQRQTNSVTVSSTVKGVNVDPSQRFGGKSTRQVIRPAHRKPIGSGLFPC